MRQAALFFTKQVLDSKASKSALHNIKMEHTEQEAAMKEGDNSHNSQVLIYKDQRYQNNRQCLFFNINMPS